MSRVRPRASLAAGLILTLAGCSTTSHWRQAALGTAALDIATTARLLDHGGIEGNPLYGPSPSNTRLTLLNAAVLGGVWLLSRDWPEERQLRLWRTVALVRLLPVAWNSYLIADSSHR